MAAVAAPWPAAFSRWAVRVRAQLALRGVLTGAAVGLLVGAVGTTAAWYFRKGEIRPWMAGAGVVGAAAGLAMARRRRWSDADVALYLDCRLGSNEAITTAIEMGSIEASERGGVSSSPARSRFSREAGDAAEVVVAHASEALGRATSKQVRAPLWSRAQIAGPVGAIAIGVLSFLPLPPPPPVPPPPPGAEIVKLADVAGLEKIIELEELDGRDEAQRQRLKALSDDAKKLREKLKNGVEKREAQSDLAKLRDGVAAERLSLGDGEQRQGLESALGKLNDNPDLKNAAKALGDRDLTELDEEMERLANTLEEKDREKAKKTLEEAAEAARKNGAEGVAKALEEQKKLLDERGKKAEALKELAKELGDGLSEDAKKALEDFEGTGGSKEEKKLAQELEKALGKLTPEERKKLVEKLKKQMNKQLEKGEAQPPSKQAAKELAEKLSTPEGQKELEEQLRKMAQDDGPESEESERQQGLDGAQKGAGEAEQQLGGITPVPTPGQPGGGDGDGKDGKGNDGKDPSAGGDGDNKDKGANGGPGPGGGKGDHAGETKKVDGDGVRARAKTKVGKGKPMPGTVLGRAPGKPGETANTQGQGQLGTVAPEEVGGVERSDVPEEYREQVGRYFQPK